MQRLGEVSAHDAPYPHGLSPALQVVTHRELWRTAACQVSHIDLLHILFNLSALWSMGLVEQTAGLGSLYYMQQTALLFILSPAVSNAQPASQPASGGGLAGKRCG